MCFVDIKTMDVHGRENSLPGIFMSTPAPSELLFAVTGHSYIVI